MDNTLRFMGFKSTSYRIIIAGICLVLLSVSLAACGQLRRDLTGESRFIQPPKSFFADRRLPRDNPGADVINKKLLPEGRKPVNRSLSPMPEPGPGAAPAFEGTPYAPPPGAYPENAGAMPPYPPEPPMYGAPQGMQPMMGGSPMNSPMAPPPMGMGNTPSMPPSPYAPEPFAAPYGDMPYPSAPGAYSKAPSYSSPPPSAGVMSPDAYPNPNYIPPPLHARTDLPDAEPPAGGMFTHGFTNRESEYVPPNAEYNQPFIPSERNLASPEGTEPAVAPGIGVLPSRAPKIHKHYTPPAETTPIPLTPKDISDDKAATGALPWMSGQKEKDPEKLEGYAPSPTEGKSQGSTVSSEEILEWYRANEPPTSTESPGPTTQKDVPNDSLPWLNDTTTPGNGAWRNPLPTDNLMVLAAIDPIKEFAIPDSEEDFLRGRNGRFNRPQAPEALQRTEKLKREIEALENPSTGMFKRTPPKQSEKPQIGLRSFDKALA